MLDRLVLFPTWHRVHRRIGVETPLVQYWSLCQHYSEPHRHYHTLEHLRNCMRVINEHYRSTRDIHLVQLALFYHDIIYDIKRQDNEAESAAYFRRAAQWSNIGNYTADVAEELILLTASHKLNPTAPILHKVMNDVDMSILAAEDEYYRTYAKNVWLEYSSVGWEAYRAGRLSFLLSVNPDELFFTAPMLARLDQARVNLAWERDVLESEPWLLLGPKPFPKN